MSSPHVVSFRSHHFLLVGRRFAYIFLNDWVQKLLLRAFTCGSAHAPVLADAAPGSQVSAFHVRWQAGIRAVGTEGELLAWRSTVRALVERGVHWFDCDCAFALIKMWGKQKRWNVNNTVDTNPEVTRYSRSGVLQSPWDSALFVRKLVVCVCMVGKMILLIPMEIRVSWRSAPLSEPEPPVGLREEESTSSFGWPGVLCFFSSLVFILVSTVFLHTVSPESHSSSFCKLKSKNVSCNLQVETSWVKTGDSPAWVTVPLL